MNPALPKRIMVMCKNIANLVEDKIYYKNNNFKKGRAG
jgi:hypothetical protein